MVFSDTFGGELSLNDLRRFWRSSRKTAHPHQTKPLQFLYDRPLALRGRKRRKSLPALESKSTALRLYVRETPGLRFCTPEQLTKFRARFDREVGNTPAPGH